MATIVNNPPATSSNTNNGMGFLLGVILVIIFAIVLFVYILPNLRSSVSQTPQVNVPGQVNVDVKTK